MSAPFGIPRICPTPLTQIVTQVCAMVFFMGIYLFSKMF